MLDVAGQEALPQSPGSLEKLDRHHQHSPEQETSSNLAYTSKGQKPVCIFFHHELHPMKMLSSCELGQPSLQPAFWVQSAQLHQGTTEKDGPHH